MTEKRMTHRGKVNRHDEFGFWQWASWWRLRETPKCWMSADGDRFSKKDGWYGHYRLDLRTIEEITDA